jgi:hypothetical protein
MNPSGGHTAGLSPDATKTAIDAALYEEYQRTQQPGYLSAQDSFFFNQSTTEGKTAFIWDEDAGIPNFQKTAEQEEISNTDTFIGNQKTKASQKYTNQVPISDEAFRADQVGKRQKIGSQQGDAARRTQDSEAILNTYGDAFAGSVNTTPDGQALASDAHVTLRGATVDNKETGAFTPDNAWTLTVSLANQKGQHGDLGSQIFEGTVVPFLLYKTAKEVLNSSLIPNSAENNLNIFDTDYGAVRIAASAFLGSAYNSASNANTSYHFVSRNHMIMRKVFYGVTTSMITPEQSLNDSYALRVKYHEITFPGSWTGYAGSIGTTA